MSQNDTTPQARIVAIFMGMREACPHYQGIKDDHASVQCDHNEQRSLGDWCGMMCCPLLRIEANKAGLE